MQPSFQFLRVIYIDYPNGGTVADSLKGKSQTVSFVADSTTIGMDFFITQLNDDLKSIPSNARVSDAEIRYTAILQGNEKL